MLHKHNVFVLPQFIRSKSASLSVSKSLGKEVSASVDQTNSLGASQHDATLHDASLYFSRRRVWRLYLGGEAIGGARLEGVAAGGGRETTAGEHRPGLQPAAVTRRP